MSTDKAKTLLTTRIQDGLAIPALDGTRRISDQTALFNYIDEDFEKFGACQPGEATLATTVTVHEVVADVSYLGAFASICTDIKKLCFTQDQIIEFVSLHREALDERGRANLFLFESGNELFVADIHCNGSKGLDAYVYHAHSNSLSGISHHRVFTL